MNQKKTANSSLPIDAIRDSVSALAEGARLVLSSPTGSGKSTQVPRWFRSKGSVLVVEPRRVACRSLAARIAELEGHPLGTKTGYIVRDDKKVSAETTVIFATPGVVLRMIRDGSHRKYKTLIIDEFHERSLDTDLLLALIQEDPHFRVIVMSATLDGERIAEHLSGSHIHAEGRLFPVEMRYLGTLNNPPETRDLEQRVMKAVESAEKDPGDILIFLPGKAEISAVTRRLSSRSQWEVFPLHGSLSLDEQSRIFRSSKKRKIIVSTNVAETSLTVPGIGVVIDSGLVRQTRYFNGRGFLTLVPIAADSAAQRAGRAGRTGPGVCYRLWSHAARLEERTRPEIHRESLVPLVLAAAACGRKVDSLPLFDRPKAYAVEVAESDLSALGALREDGELTPIGSQLFHLPMDPLLGRLLVEARKTSALADMVDLVAAISVGRPLFRSGPPPEGEDNLKASGSDALAWIRALREGDAMTHHLQPYVLGEARRISGRLRKAFALPRLAEAATGIDIDALGKVILAADPRCVHVARNRKKSIAWSNGGTEIEVGRESALDPEKWQAIAVLSSRAMTTDKNNTLVIATCVLPLPLPWLVRAELGRERVSETSVRNGVITATLERVYAKKVIGTRKSIPEGKLAREALVELLERGSLYRETLSLSRRRFARWTLAHDLIKRGTLTWDPIADIGSDFSTWVRQRVESLGVETGEDVGLLSKSDFLVDELPYTLHSSLDKDYPERATAGDTTYEVVYDLSLSKVCLKKIKGQRKDLPSLQYLPKFRGFSIEIEDRGKIRKLRGRN